MKLCWQILTNFSLIKNSLGNFEYQNSVKIREDVVCAQVTTGGCENFPRTHPKRSGIKADNW